MSAPKILIIGANGQIGTELGEALIARHGAQAVVTSDLAPEGRLPQVAHEALRPAGVLAIWSAEADEAFAKRVAKAGFDVEEVQVYAHGKRGTRHTLWFGTKRSRAPGGAKAASPARAGAASPKATAAAAVPRGASRRSR